MEKYHLPGASAAVAIGGKIVWSEAFGEADLENHVPATRATRFRLGSVSKLITAAAVALLVQRGALDLDAPVQRYVPTFPVKQSPVTARELVTHTSGIRHYSDSDAPKQAKHYKTVVEGLSVFQDDPLLFEPGTRYTYSSYGFNLLSAVVEGAAAKQDFLTFVQTQVAGPLGLTLTADQTDAVVDHRTRFYYYGPDHAFHNAPAIDPSYKWASGGFLATADDLARFGSAHLAPGFFTPETISLLFTPQRLQSGEPVHANDFSVGLAWRIGTNKQGRRIYHHGGAIEGGRAFLLIEPDSKTVVAILANSYAPFAEIEANDLAQIFSAAGQ